MKNYKEFLGILNCGPMMNVKNHLSQYLKHVPVGNREMYQMAKMIEEIGECLQALHAENFAPKSWSDYCKIRGTFESEAADVVIAAIGVIHLAGKNLSLTICRDNAQDDTLFMRELISAVEYGSPARAIGAVYHYCQVLDIDIMRHIQARLEFNSELLRGKNVG